MFRGNFCLGIFSYSDVINLQHGPFAVGGAKICMTSNLLLNMRSTLLPYYSDGIGQSFHVVRSGPSLPRLPSLTTLIRYISSELAPIDIYCTVVSQQAPGK